MQKEILNEEVMQKFLDGFADEGWKECGDSVYLESDDGKETVVYTDLGTGPDGSSTELTLWKDDELAFQFQQEVTDEGIENYLIVPPYKEEYWDGGRNWCGVVYDRFGNMNPVRNVKGLPRKIDMEKTVELFLKQVAEKRFTQPELVKPKRIKWCDILGK